MPGRRRFCRMICGAGCSTMATTREAMNRADLTGVPVRVTSLTSTVPREVETSIRRPALVASISYFRTPFPESTTISTRSPLMIGQYCYRGTRPKDAPGLVRSTLTKSMSPTLVAGLSPTRSSAHQRLVIDEARMANTAWTSPRDEYWSEGQEGAGEAGIAGSATSDAAAPQTRFRCSCVYMPVPMPKTTRRMTLRAGDSNVGLPAFSSIRTT